MKNLEIKKIEINGKEIECNCFAYDGEHKIYLIDNIKDLINNVNLGYNILPIEKLKETYENSDELKFIYNANLEEKYVKQYENANIKLL